VSRAGREEAERRGGHSVATGSCSARQSEEEEEGGNGRLGEVGTVDVLDEGCSVH
jgi:hypothetical protein